MNMEENRQERIEELSRNMETGDLLKEMRKEKGITLAELGKEIGGVSVTYLSEIERGQKVPSDHLVRQLADYYDIDEDFLFAKFGKVPMAARRVFEDNPLLLKTLADIGRSDGIPEDMKQDLYDYLHNLYKHIANRKN
ncbi:helix-turn-helix domain-containing protein [Heliobacillus mobilis]|uniref:Helix-turn-helix domain-containing protein n=1 Tax=Heliobacterium mobile TaxID=28064 RepID=A0A6I3SRU8_HELMO|nr:helix-turn-helix transcriptional regulator [Heliobacterium mobile]MTV50777.1 helix-turn-helix domain-containing protein [Heliobacterium mobile]